jgi:hypothetical protein
MAESGIGNGGVGGVAHSVTVIGGNTKAVMYRAYHGNSLNFFPCVGTLLLAAAPPPQSPSFLPSLSHFSSSSQLLFSSPPSPLHSIPSPHLSSISSIS